MSTISAEVRHVFISGTQIPSGFGHLYLVYKNDEGEEFIIEGYPAGSFPFFGRIVTDLGVPIGPERDENGDPTSMVRGIKELSLGERDPEDTWALLLQHAENIEDERISYDPLAQNSNSTIVSLLQIIGLDVAESLPNSNLSLPGLANSLVFDYRLTGGDGPDVMSGLAGADSFHGGDGADDLEGGSGGDILVGGSGNDELFGESGNDFLYGESGSDLLAGGEGDDEAFGGKGVDMAYGDLGDDRALGSKGKDSLFGGSGDDHLLGQGSSDLLYGGSGEDFLVGGGASDTAYGGAGNDTFLVETVSDVVRELDGEGDQDLVRSKAPDYTLADGLEGFVENANIAANVGGATLVGNGLDNVLKGNSGADRLVGGSGSDLLLGRDDDDELFGGSGFDSLKGGNGDDTLWLTDEDRALGGSGIDFFAFDGAPLGDNGTGGPVINDFQGVLLNPGADQDKLLFATGVENGVFTFIGDADFTGDGNSQARFDHSRQVQVDSNGDGTTDIAFEIKGLTSANLLTSSDFLFLT